MYGPGPFLYVIFLMIGWILMLYTLNFYYLVYQSSNNIRHNKKIRQKTELPTNLPVVTIQLPLYNEKYVAKRLIDAVCRTDYPKDKLHIQVLDDSDDDTVDLIKSIVDDYRLKGFDIVCMHRTDRSGYKAGALKAGMKHAKGEFVVIFDEDLDLSYRAQMKGWKCLFLEGVEVDAELPVQMNAAKRQQFRWAKGSIQVALKLLSDVMLNRKVPADTKVQAFIQLTRHVVNP